MWLFSGPGLVLLWPEVPLHNSLCVVTRGEILTQKGGLESTGKLESRQEIHQSQVDGSDQDIGWGFTLLTM